MLFVAKALENEKVTHESAGANEVNVGRFMASHLPNRMNSIAVARKMIQETKDTGTSNRVWLRGNDKIKVTLELAKV